MSSLPGVRYLCFSGALGVLVAVAGAGCGDDGGGDGTAGGAGKAAAGAGGSTGIGGATTGKGGASTGTGGASTGTGGASTGTGGASTGTGGASTGTGGTSAGAAGANTGTGGASSGGGTSAGSSAGGTNAGAAGGAGSTGGTGGTTSGSAGAAGSGAVCKDPKEIPVFTDGPLHLEKACSPYHVAAPSIVRSGDFTIEAGVTITFAPAADLTVGAGSSGTVALAANGTENDPIVLGPDAASAAKGSWHGLTLEGGSSAAGTLTLRHVRIEGAGTAAAGSEPPLAALVANAPALLDHVTIAGSKGFGLSLAAPLESGSAALSFSDVDERLIEAPFDAVSSLPAITSGTGNAKAAIGVGTGPSANGTWVSQPVPFHMLHSQTIGDGAKGESTVVTIEKNTLLFAPEAGLSVGATEGQTGTGDLVANDVRFDAIDPTKPWEGITFVARYTTKTALVGGHIGHAVANIPASTNIPNTSPTAYNNHYASVFVGQSAVAAIWAKISGVTIEDVTPVPPPAPLSQDVSVATCIIVRGIPCDAPAPSYDAGTNTLNCTKKVLDYDSCVGP